MAIAIDGTGSITGISAGGLPNGTVDTDVIAANAVTEAKLGSDEQKGLAKAWVNFNGTGTVAIRDSFNVASITDNGTGEYSITFTNAMANANYAVTGTVGITGSTGASDLFMGGGRQSNYSDIRTTGAARIASCNAAGVAEDGAIVSLVVFGD